MGLELTEYLRYAGALFFVLALIGLLVWVLRRFGNGKMSSGGKRGRRLAVSEAAMVDKRRRLVLIRRDNQEHLVMIGGPQDLLIETGITPAQPSADEATHVQAQEPPRRDRPLPPEPLPSRAATRHPEQQPRSPVTPPRPRTIEREHPQDRMPERALRQSIPEREPPVYTERKTADRLKPQEDEQSAPSQERRSLLNVRPGDTR